MTQLSQKQLEANRRNAQKCTGPKSTAGKKRSRLNAVKHGLTAQIPVLPGEDPTQFHTRVDGYKTDLQPRGTLENDLVEQMAQQAWQIDRALTADAARLTIKIQTAAAESAVRDADQAAALGQRLFFDRRGPTPLFPSVKLQGRSSARTSRTDQPDDPDDPVRLLILLESNTAGCRFLLDCWAALRDRIETGQCWQSPEKLRGIRMLGRQPLDCADHRDVAEVLLACHVLDPQHKQAFSEVRCEMDDDEWKAYARRLEGRNYTAITPVDAPAARAVLLGVVDKATRRLNLLVTTHQERDAQVAALNVHALAFDATAEGERLRRYKNACERAFHRTIATLLKVRKEVDIPVFDDDLVPEPQPQDDLHRVPEHPAEEVHDLRNETIGTAFNDLEGDPAAAARDPAHVADEAYRDALEIAIANRRDPEAEPKPIDMVPLKAAIEVHADHILAWEELEKAREIGIGRPNYYRADEPHPAAVSPRPGDPLPAGGDPGTAETARGPMSETTAAQRDLQQLTAPGVLSSSMELDSVLEVRATLVNH